MIEFVSKNNLDEVLPLIRQYMEFYKIADISDSKNQVFFSRFGEHSSEGCQFLYRQDGTAVAFATLYFTYTSSITAKVAVLNDLYTLPECRRTGIARKLINHCQDYAKTMQAARLQWVTAVDNLPAQKLYDSMQTNKSQWCFYTYPT